MSSVDITYLFAHSYQKACDCRPVAVCVQINVTTTILGLNLSCDNAIVANSHFQNTDKKWRNVKMGHILVTFEGVRALRGISEGCLVVYGAGQGLHQL